MPNVVDRHSEVVQAYARRQKEMALRKAERGERELKLFLCSMDVSSYPDLSLYSKAVIRQYGLVGAVLVVAALATVSAGCAGETASQPTEVRQETGERSTTVSTVIALGDGVLDGRTGVRLNPKSGGTPLDFELAFIDQVPEDGFNADNFRGAVTFIVSKGIPFPSPTNIVIINSYIPGGTKDNFAMSDPGSRTIILSHKAVSDSVFLPGYTKEGLLNGAFVGELCNLGLSSGGELPGGLPRTQENVQAVCDSLGLMAAAVFSNLSFEDYKQSLPKLELGGPGPTMDVFGFGEGTFNLFRETVKGPVFKIKSGR